jgi:hypothetical protein
VLTPFILIEYLLKIISLNLIMLLIIIINIINAHPPRDSNTSRPRHDLKYVEGLGGINRHIYILGSASNIH